MVTKKAIVNVRVTSKYLYDLKNDILPKLAVSIIVI